MNVLVLAPWLSGVARFRLLLLLLAPLVFAATLPRAFQDLCSYHCTVPCVCSSYQGMQVCTATWYLIPDTCYLLLPATAGTTTTAGTTAAATTTTTTTPTTTDTTTTTKTTTATSRTTRLLPPRDWNHWQRFAVFPLLFPLLFSHYMYSWYLCFSWSFLKSK